MSASPQKATELLRGSKMTLWADAVEKGKNEPIKIFCLCIRRNPLFAIQRIWLTNATGRKSD
jgi:hypothetical protein